MEEFFQILKRERETRNITLEAIAEHTRININILQALENGDFEQLHSVYARLFIKKYIDFIGLDSADLLGQYDEYIRSGESPTPVEETLAYNTIESNGEADEVPPVAEWKSVKLFYPFIGGILVIIFIGYFIVGKVKNLETPQNNDYQEELQESPQHVQTRQPNLVASADSISPPHAKLQVPRPDSLSLKIIANKYVWIKIARGTGEVLLERSVRKDFVEIFKAQEKFEIKLERSDGVDLWLNEKKIILPTSPPLVVPKLVLDASGIVEKRYRTIPVEIKLPQSDSLISSDSTQQ